MINRFVVMVLMDFGDGLPRVEPYTLITGVLKTIYFIFGALAIISITIAAANMIANGSKPETVATSRNRIIYSAIGLVITILAWPLTDYVMREIAK